MTDYSTISVVGGAPEPTAGYYELREPVIFPYGLTPITVEGEENMKSLQRAMSGNRLLAIFPELPPEEELHSLPHPVTIPSFEFGGRRHSGIGVLARVVKRLELPDGSVRIVLRGTKRINFSSLSVSAADGAVVQYRNITENRDENSSQECFARQRSITLLFQELISMLPGYPEELQLAVYNAQTPGRFADILADSLNFSRAEKVMLLAMVSIRERLEYLAVLLNREVEVTKLGMRLQSEVREAVSSSQREFYLREQLRAIRQELGEESGNPDIVEIEQRLTELTLPDPVLAVIRKELDRLNVIPQAAPEYHISYSYINWLLDLPWCNDTEDRLDCAEAARVLDEDHYGLEDVKNRILEFLSVLQLRREQNPDEPLRAPILCLVGPPGVGKTSLGKSVARAMNRKFIRVSLGGVRDEAEIRGHRRTYVGAMPGRIIQNLKRIGSGNPVFMLDEVDKLCGDFRGDPGSALLEVLDPAQNSNFNDNYIELGFDLSRVFFIATANVLDTIPGPLLDRMEIIRLPGYTSFEKREIARRYLVPRQLAENGLHSRQVRFRMAAIDELIDYYTREAGVRSLERVIAQLCRRIVRRLVAGEYAGDAVITVTPALVNELLGARKFLRDDAERTPGTGCATGLAWTAVGGVILPIETVAIPGGKGELKLTGSLGKVMQESATTAFTLLRSCAGEWGHDPEYFQKNDFHIHVPDGATPKDGPSAGITMLLAMISLLRGRPLRPLLAMTGEITLQGRVTAIGGVREKMVAALRAGIRDVLLPEENRKDFLELPENIRKHLNVKMVSDFRQAVEFAFEPTGKSRRPKSRKAARNNENVK